jgi:hypothetical protein
MTYSILSMISHEAVSQDGIVHNCLHPGKVDADPYSRPNLFSSQSPVPSEFTRNVSDPASSHTSDLLAYGGWEDRIYSPSGGNQISDCAADSVSSHFIDWGQHIGGQGLSAWSSNTPDSVCGFPQPFEAGPMSARQSFIRVLPPSAESGAELKMIPALLSHTIEQVSMGSTEPSPEQSKVGDLVEKDTSLSTLDAGDETKSLMYDDMHGVTDGDALNLWHMVETIRVQEEVIVFELVPNVFTSF